MLGGYSPGMAAVVSTVKCTRGGVHSGNNFRREASEGAEWQATCRTRTTTAGPGGVKAGKMWPKRGGQM